ncbi:MAG: hypothetical protein J7L12_02890 [Desulfurococcales archaeon]|nr:hypothetical protein [Desulfurococcales archaeon]
MYTKEYVVNDHIKVVYVCNENGACIVIGDLPALYWCFDEDDELSVSESRLCYSKRLTINVEENVVQVVIEGAEVLGKVRSVSFIAYGVRSNLNPEVLYRVISEYVMSVCSNSISRS